MWVLVLLLNLVVIFIGFLWVDERLKSRSGLEEIVKRYRKEIDEVTLAFNSSSADHIALLEARVAEIRNLLKLVDERMAAYKKVLEELEGKTRSLARERLDRLVAMVREGDGGGERVEGTAKAEARPASGRRRKAMSRQEKEERILAAFREGLSVREIAERLDISEEEVRFHLQRGEIV